MKDFSIIINKSLVFTPKSLANESNDIVEKQLIIGDILCLNITLFRVEMLSESFLSNFDGISALMGSISAASIIDSEYILLMIWWQGVFLARLLTKS